jgi:hypothetical protein
MPNVHILSFAVSTIRPRKKMRYSVFILQREYIRDLNVILIASNVQFYCKALAERVVDRRQHRARLAMLTNATCRHGSFLSAIGARPEIICSL